jgi:serine/threonine-protein kinase
MAVVPPVLAHELAEKYRVLLELGHGGTSNVFLAMARGQKGFNKLVVVKVPNATVARDPELLELFLVEARLAARLNHANIVQTNEIAESGSRPMIVMEYLEGQALSKIVERAKSALSLPMHLRIISESLSGLHHAHECLDFDGTKLDVVHRDMTPHNVFVTYDGQVKIIDFGIAKVKKFGHETETGIIKGKVRYMPAEQIGGEPVDRRADIYAVGVMLWEAAARQPIFQGVSDRDILNHVLNGEVPSPREFNPEVTPELERVCMKALALERDDRHANALELQADIERFIESFEGSRPLTGRDLGRFVAEHFADERATVRASIESRLADSSSADASTHSAATFSTRAAPARSGVRTSLIGGGVLVAVVVLVAWTMGRTPDQAGTTPSSELAPASKTAVASLAVPAASSTAGAPSVSAPSSSVHVRIAAVPRQAKITLDGVRLSANPYSANLPRSAERHEVEAAASGYAPVKKSFQLDADVDLTLTLVPLGTAPKPPATKKPSCNPPYVIDENGLKRYIPGCF